MSGPAGAQAAAIAPAAARPQVSIVCACCNEKNHIRAFVDSVLAQDMRHISWEAIFADGMSDDGTRKILEEYCARDSRLRVIHNPERIVSTGLNAGIRAARGEVIIRMDAHTKYASDYCLRSVEELRRTGADNVGGPARTAARGKLARAVAGAYHSSVSTGGARFHREEYEGWVDTVPYGCWLKSTLEEIGLFDSELVRNQDDELNFRLRLAGGKIWQTPSIVSWYSPRSTVGGLFGQYFQYGYWKVAVIRKHGTPAAWRHLVPAAFVLGNVAAPLVILLAAALGMTSLPLLAVWLACLCAYAALLLVAAVGAARKSGWDILPWLPVVFCTYHISYGVGFLFGLVRFPARQREAAGDSIFGRLTR